jgi:hypothetical protein
MSDTSMGPGWWMASDGRWYSPEQAPGAVPPPPPQFHQSAGGAPTLAAPRMVQQPAPTPYAYPGTFQVPAGYALTRKKKRRWPWIVLAVVVALIIAGALAGSAEEEATTSAPAADAPAADAPAAEAPAAEPAAPAPAPVSGPLTVGTTGNTSGFDVTLLQYVDQWQSTNQFEAPSAGMRFVAVELDMVNTRDEVLPFSTMLGLELIDSLGQRWNIAFAGFDLPRLDGEVAPGSNIRGWQVFEVPADATGLRLKVEGSITASGIEFQLS